MDARTPAGFGSRLLPRARDDDNITPCPIHNKRRKQLEGIQARPRAGRGAEAGAGQQYAITFRGVFRPSTG
eukprot:2333583-Pleurochrysis_carterae.AAC.4